MLQQVRSTISIVARRFRSRAVLELENLALRHQLHVLRRQRPGRLRLFTFDRWLWVWLYRLWPRCLDTMIAGRPDARAHRRGVAACLRETLWVQANRARDRVLCLTSRGRCR